MIKIYNFGRVTVLYEVLVILILYLTSEAVTFQVDLEMPRYVLSGQSATLKCSHGVPEDSLRKVEWLQAGKKIFQYIKNRVPPFINYTVHGAELNLEQSNERQIYLTNLNFDATGIYTCEVSTEIPIYTKSSDEKELTVIQRQADPPEVSVRKKIFTMGEMLEANCTSSPARPVPHITWLVNGEKVDDSQMRMFPRHPEHSATVQLSMELEEYGSGNLVLTCLSTIPAYQDSGAEGEHYVDKKSKTLKVMVVVSSAARVPTISLQICVVFISIVFHVHSSNLHRIVLQH